MRNASVGKRSYSQATPLYASAESTLKLTHEQCEVRDFPMLCELSVFDSVELKGHRVDASARGLEANEFSLVRPSNGVQDSDAVTLSHNRRNRQRQIRKRRAKCGEVLLEDLSSWSLPRQMIVVAFRDDLVQDLEVAAFNGVEKAAYECFVLFYRRRHIVLLQLPSLSSPAMSPVSPRAYM